MARDDLQAQVTLQAAALAATARPSLPLLPLGEVSNPYSFELECHHEVEMSCMVQAGYYQRVTVFLHGQSISEFSGVGHQQNMTLANGTLSLKVGPSEEPLVHLAVLEF